MLKRALLFLMAAFYVLAGANHFLKPEVYLPMLPPYLPWHLLLIYISGLAELGLGIAIVIPRFRRRAAWGFILLLIAIFPANLHIALHDVPLFGNPQGFGVWNWIRLPFQALLIAWAWWYTRD